MMRLPPRSTFFFFNDTATTEIYTLSLHDALPICVRVQRDVVDVLVGVVEHSCLPLREGGHLRVGAAAGDQLDRRVRSEEHTSELQSRQYLVCRLLLEKKKTISRIPSSTSKKRNLI